MLNSRFLIKRSFHFKNFLFPYSDFKLERRITLQLYAVTVTPIYPFSNHHGTVSNSDPCDTVVMLGYRIFILYVMLLQQRLRAFR